jgi:hypothetical protein
VASIISLAATDSVPNFVKIDKIILKFTDALTNCDEYVKAGDYRRYQCSSCAQISENEMRYCRDALLTVNQSDSSHTTSRHEQCLAPGCSQTQMEPLTDTATLDPAIRLAIKGDVPQGYFTMLVFDLGFPQW